MNEWINKLSSACINDIRSGLRGMHSTMSISQEQLEDEIIQTRLMIIKEFQLKGIMPVNDLVASINCINVDCKNIERCNCRKDYGTPTMHFEIPQIVSDFGNAAITYLGTIDRQTPFIFYTSSQMWNYYHKYKRRGKDKPFVYIDITPNENGMLDCYIFNAPLLKTISISAVFKDPRQLCNYECSVANDEVISWITGEIQKRIVESKIRLYRQLAAPILPNTQKPEAG